MLSMPIADIPALPEGFRIMMAGNLGEAHRLNEVMILGSNGYLLVMEARKTGLKNLLRNTSWKIRFSFWGAILSRQCRLFLHVQMLCC